MSSTLTETVYRYVLRSYYDVQVLTASNQFFEDVVGTWSSVTGPETFEFEAVSTTVRITQNVR